MPAAELILWDGECGFCRRCVQWVERHDERGAFESSPYQQATTPPMTPELAVACERAVHVVRRDGSTLRAGRAVLYILGEIGWPRVATMFARPPLIWLVELAYAIVAANRRLFSRIFFRADRG